MWLFNKLQTVINQNATSKTKTTSTRSLLAVLQAVDFNVYRFRENTGIMLIGPRGWQQPQKHLTDSSVIDLESGYKLYCFNIDQLIRKCNNMFPNSLKNEQGIPSEQNIRNTPNLVIKSTSKNDKVLPDEIISDLWIYQDEKTGLYKANKSGYAGYITLNDVLVPLRKTRYSQISIKWSPSKKMIYRQTRDWSLDESFIKVIGEYIISTVVDQNGKALIDIDIEPTNYHPQKEKSSDSDNESTTTSKSDLDFNISIDSTSFDNNEFDNDFDDKLIDTITIKTIYLQREILNNYQPTKWFYIGCTVDKEGHCNVLLQSNTKQELINEFESDFMESNDNNSLGYVIINVATQKVELGFEGVHINTVKSKLQIVD